MVKALRIPTGVKMSPLFLCMFFCLLFLPLEHRTTVKRSLHFSFLKFRQSVGLLGRGISPSQGLYLHTGQHKHRINVRTPNIHARGGIRIHDHGGASENSSCLRPLGYRDRPCVYLDHVIGQCSIDEILQNVLKEYIIS
jgi:hypothetical protein